MGSEHTRERLIDAAEQLMADRGVDGVSLREIGRAAGERNTGVVQYHFGSKEALITAIFERRMARLDAVRRRMLDDLERTGALPSLHAVVGTLIYPQIRFLIQNPEEGATYLLFVAQVHRHVGRRVADHAREVEALGLLRLEPLVKRNLPHLPEALVAERFALVVCYVVQALAEHALLLRTTEPDAPPVDSVAFAQTLVDTAASLLSAPVTRTAAAMWDMMPATI